MFHELDELAPQRGQDGYFSRYTTLDGLPHQAYALYLLRRCAYIAAPIMRRHNWTVPMLNELSPDSDCNGKTHTAKRVTTRRSHKTIETIPLDIELRLRDDYDLSQFIPMHHLMRTMLHELTHLVYRRHFLGFYTFNQELLNELIRDVKKGPLRRRVYLSDVPERIAHIDEMACTVKDDLKKSFVEMIGGGKKDQHRHRR
jgi:hypothetical protein